ncbi:MAG: sigma-70 family RNA polymerase sigma factor [Bryobacterales bacterium]|nr:sigma-70 family RNA polymerase sigma factor [Bryobacterales bacterium]
MAQVTGLSPADALLLNGLRSGDEQAYEALIERFQNPVFSLVYRLMADPGDAGDVVQEVFLKVFRSVGSFRGQSSLKTWIYRIAVNEANNHRRWFARKKCQEIGLEEDQGDGHTFEQILPDHSPTPFEIALDHETQDCIEAALQELKPVFRQAVVLRDIEGLAYDEIADILQVSLGTVKSRILRGRELLRSNLLSRLRVEPKFELAPQGVD